MALAQRGTETVNPLDRQTFAASVCGRHAPAMTPVFVASFRTISLVFFCVGRMTAISAPIGSKAISGCADEVSVSERSAPGSRRPFPMFAGRGARSPLLLQILSWKL